MHHENAHIPFLCHQISRYLSIHHNMASHRISSSIIIITHPHEQTLSFPWPKLLNGVIVSELLGMIVVKA